MGMYNRIFAGKTESGAAVISFTNDGDARALLALEALKSHVMIADEHNVIVSLNASVEHMLRQAEADIRKDLPHFSVNALKGTTMDVFHKNPAHQTALLSRLTAAHEAAIRVGGREFTLTAIPLFKQGRRLGTAIEWQDNTERNALKRLEQAAQQKDQARSNELNIITTALDTVSSNVMMADPDGIIFYANKSVLQLLKNAEADMRQALPGFSAESLVGKSFDAFHRNPAHQQSLLKRLTGPYESAIRVGPRHFHLKAAPVFDANGKRLGTVVEWLDRTAEIQLEQSVEHTIKAAITGNLSERINQQGHSGFIAKIATGVNQLLEIFDGVLTDAEGSLNALAHGNLCKKISNDYQGRYDGLKSDINTTIDKLTSIVTSIEAATANVMQGTQEISEGINCLSQRTEQQAASLEETSAAMEQITRTVEQNSLSAVMANDLSRDARVVAEDGGNVLERAVASMNTISESSRKIEEIISVIDGIAFQTNLLALNAAVEAARAGDHGRGFAVVASEVRSLAGRSAKAAKEIKELIRDSGNKVQEGSALVNKSGDTFTRIIQSVKKVNNIVDEITGGSKEQSKGLSEINKAVQDMDEMTQQNAALVEEAAATSESLYQRSVALHEMMQFFDTGRR